MRVPALVLCGATDRANIPLSKELVQEIPGAQLHIVAGATHLWNRRQPETVNRIVGDVIDRSTAHR